MRTFIRNITARIYKPLVVRYLSATKTYTYKNIRLTVPPGVFHPGFFWSTHLLLRYISGHALPGKSFLELGAGSGLISFFAAHKGALVTATDINPTAIAFLEKNRQDNGVQLQIIHSDLFRQVPPASFDIIAINPPYYKKNPHEFSDYAWYCGENGEYFDRLFSTLKPYTHHQSAIWMVLCDACDLEMISSMANQHGWTMHCVQEKKNLMEKNFIFRIAQTCAA